MKYTKFIIKNYKGIPEIDLDLSKKPESSIFTLVGLNESGKTSILEAIYLFQKDISKEKAHTLIPKSKQHSFNEKILITAELELSDDDLREVKAYLMNNHSLCLEESKKIIQITKEYRFKRSLPASDDENNWQETDWELNFGVKKQRARKIKDLYDHSPKILEEVINLIEQKIPRILYYQDFLFQFPEKIYLEEHEGEREEQKEYRNVIQDVLYLIDSELTVKEDLLDRIKNRNEGSHRQALDQLLLRMSDKLNKEILQKWNTIFRGAQQQEATVSAGTEPDSGRVFIELNIKQGPASYSINDRSLGFRWFFSFLIFTAFRKSRIEDPGETLFLLDEPASNLHPSSQHKLLHSLENVVSDCKLIYSTHSHHLINPKWLTGTYIVKNKAIDYNNAEDSTTVSSIKEVFGKRMSS